MTIRTYIYLLCFYVNKCMGSLHLEPRFTNLGFATALILSFHEMNTKKLTQGVRSCSRKIMSEQPWKGKPAYLRLNE